MMRIASLTLIAAVAACGNAARDEAQDATNQFRMVEASGSAADKCEAARRAADAWLKAGDQNQYELYRSTRDTWCMSARLDR